MGKKKLKVAVVGAGYWGKNLVRVFSRLGALDTICDSDIKRLEEMKKGFPFLKVTRYYSEVLNNNFIDAVVISTPANSHYELAKKALLAGKDVFVEKPLSLTLENGEELIKLAERKKKVLMVGHLLEYHPAVNKLKTIIKKGELGRIQYIYSNRLNLGKFRREENILWSFAPHDISAILSILNEMPESVSVFGGNYLHRDIADVTVSNLKFPSGIKGHIFVSWLHPYKEQKLIVVGNKKMAVFDDTAKKDKLLIYNHKIDWVNGLPFPRKVNAKSVEVKMKEPLLLECSHFLNSIKTRKKPKTDGKSALRVLEVLHSCQESLENGGLPVSLGLAAKKKAIRNNYYAHPTSIIEQPSGIGKGTKIWHYSHIMNGAKIGENCNIGQNVFIGSKAELGDNVKVQNNVSIYDCVKLEDDVFCGPSVVFTNVINPRSHISRKNEYQGILVKKGATLGANATVICGNSIGEYAFIGAGSVVTRDVAPFSLVYGNPAKQRGWMCKCAKKIEIKGKRGVCRFCKEGYIFSNGILKPISKIKA